MFPRCFLALNLLSSFEFLLLYDMGPARLTLALSLCWAFLRSQGNLILVPLLPRTWYVHQAKLMLGEMNPPQDHLAKAPPPVTQSPGCIPSL